ncbi:MAG: histidinol-phosphate aminotransferase family protein [Clostridia bacterium]|nr:histidinol-phosphate aminotransferase family protein [Clostridia bacterium]
MSITHGGDVWRRGAPESWLDFSANLNPEGPPDWVRAAMAAGLENAAFYPDPRSEAALAGLSAHLAIPADCLLPANGGIEAAAIAAGMSERHVIVQPTFQEYARLCRQHRDASWDGLRTYAPEPGECLWLCNPNNPTGGALTRAEVLELLSRMEAAGGRLIVDEAFVGYCPEHSVVDAVSAHPALIVLGSLTKILTIPGARLGYLAAHPSVIAGLRDGLPPWRLNCLADAVAAALPGHAADFERVWALNAHRREKLAAALEALGARVYPGAANFLLCDFGRDMRPAIERLRERSVLVRPCGMFPGLTHGHLRLCVRTEAENARLIEALREACAK